jgi:xanthine dehydrogenase accessory factor
MRCYSGGVLDVLIEPNLPKPGMVVVGYESIPEADVIINELNLPALALGGEAFMVIATHGRYDEEALKQAAQTGVVHALVASPKRAGVILDQLRERGVAGMERIKSPAGLDIGAQGAEEIALSIVAEIVQERRAGRLKKASVVPREEAPGEAIDPICNMTVTIAGARYSSEHDGKRFYFCCAHCQRTFEKDPNRYAHVA